MASAASSAATSTVPAAAAAPACRSWASIVRGAEQASGRPAAGTPAVVDGGAVPAPGPLECVPAASTASKALPATEPERRMLCPAVKGMRLCQCSGRVLAVLRNHGWIEPLEPIDHPATSKNSGHVYVASHDIEGGISLQPGDQVRFYLYVDAQGLGAEACCLTSRATVAAWPSTFYPDAKEFVPAGASLWTSALSAYAEEFVPGGLSSMNADAPEFAPSAEESAPAGVQGSMSARAPEFVPSAAVPGVPVVDSSAPAALGGLDRSEINAAYFSDSDDDSEDEGAEAGDEASSRWSEGDGPLADSELEEEDVETEEALTSTEEDEVEVDDELDVVVMCAPLKATQWRAPSPDGSTSAGEESEDEDVAVSPRLCAFRAPPGLSLLAVQ
eukprot:CAMPEP_0175559628 /NCGR_PEP_ID=MMETSP0096-20121207/36498_1 /TAXON_ID=311494 /ORGANISM="Alexandrium monilatum, Strain CCMP3105" /LENGTH=386 /DNA_ID=CAMNT_0016862833 /DNA_START=6 /DNA_END=1166 /DNA_ORIENTATION=+